MLVFAVYFIYLYFFNANREQNIVKLIEGEPFYASLDAETYKYFVFEATEPKSVLTFTAKLFIGSDDLEMYISTFNTQPNNMNYLWRSRTTNNNTSALIEIPLTDPNFQLGNFYIGLFFFFI